MAAKHGVMEFLLVGLLFTINTTAVSQLSDGTWPRFGVGPGDSIGFSFNDFLTNGSPTRNLVRFEDGQFSFIRAALSDTVAGTAGNFFKHFDGANWTTDWEPISPTRSSWGSIDQIYDAGGVEVVVGHPAMIFLHASRTGGWSEYELFCAEELWPRLAIGSGFDIHLIATEGPTNIGYHRSTDAGATWSCDNYLMTHPGARVDADGYDIAAQGDNVAFAVAGEGGDVVLLESTDRGVSWTETIIYDIDESGKTPGHEPPDGSVSIIYDADTQPHVAWGSFLYDKDGFLVESLDAGIRHWSAVTGVQEIAWPDPDPSIVNPGGRGGNLATGPDLCASDDGSLFMLFSRFISETDSNGNNYEHVFGIGSAYAGMDWQTVIDVTPGAGFDAAFPSAADRVDNAVHFTYTSDPYAGNWIRGNHDRVPVAYMVHSIEKGAFFTVSVGGDEEIQSSFSLKQNFPNPFNGISNFEFEIGMASNISLRVFDIVGRELALLAEGVYMPGIYRVQWDAPFLSTGVYWYRLKAIPVDRSPASAFVASRKMILLR